MPISNKSCDVTRVNEIRIVSVPTAPILLTGIADLIEYTAPYSMIESSSGLLNVSLA